MDKNKILESAAKLVAKGAYDKAVKEYQKVLRTDPRDVRVLQKLGELHQKKGDNAQAAQFFIKVAEGYSEEGFFLKAVALYKQVLKLNPSLVNVNLRLGELHQQLQLMSEAAAYYQLVASQYEQAGDIRSSLNIFKKLVDLSPDNVTSRVKLGELYSRENMPTEAADELKRAAGYLKLNKRLEDLQRVLERLCALDPNNLQTARELAEAYLAAGDQKRALTKLQLCFNAQPREIETLELLARAFIGMGQQAKAASVYKELVKLLTEQNRLDEAADFRLRLQQIEPNESASVRNLTESLITSAAKRAGPVESSSPGVATDSPATGSTEPAGQDQFGKILTETDVYLKYGLFDRALEHLGKIFAVDPENLEAHERAYQVYAASDSRTQASEQQLNVLRLCTRFGQVERGRPYLEALMRENPGHPELPVFQSVLGGGGDPQSAGIEVLSDAEILIESEDTDPQGHWPILPEEEAIEDLALESVESQEGMEVVADEGEEAPTPNWDEPLLQAPEPGADEALPVEQLSDEPPAEEYLALDQGAEESVEEESLALDQGVEESLEEVPLEDRIEDPPAAEELAEATFFIEQGLVEEAREILETIVIAYPGHVGAEALLGSLGEPDQAEIDSLAQETVTADFQYSVEDVFAEFKKGLEKVVTPQDVDTHYDLGIAYKEMGLLDDAINEFSVARQGCLHQKREIDCLTMIGLLQLAKGEPAAAVGSFQEALSSEHATSDMQKALEYELAMAWENAGSAGKALYRYQRVSNLDPSYRDVARKISQLSAHAQPEEDATAGNGALGVEDGRGAKDSGDPDSESGAPNRTSAGGRRKVGYM